MEAQSSSSLCWCRGLYLQPSLFLLKSSQAGHQASDSTGGI